MNKRKNNLDVLTEKEKQRCVIKWNAPPLMWSMEGRELEWR